MNSVIQLYAVVVRKLQGLVFNPITVDNYAFFLNGTPVGRTSDSMMAPT